MERAIDWVVTKCATCGCDIHQRHQDENRRGVYEQNCPRCRQKMGHPTHIDWLGWDEKQKAKAKKEHHEGETTMADESTFTAIKDAIDNQSKAFDLFKKTSDERLDAIKNNNELRILHIDERLAAIEGNNRTEKRIALELKLNRVRLDEIEAELKDLHEYVQSLVKPPYEFRPKLDAKPLDGVGAPAHEPEVGGSNE